MHTKQKAIHVCQQCGGQVKKWVGQCPHCHAWNSLVFESVSVTQIKQAQTLTTEKPVLLNSVTCGDQERIDCGCPEFNRVLGGGLVPGSVVLLGGAPGVGKSTLLLQITSHLAQHHPILYISGEESLEQIAMRAHRASCDAQKLHVLAATQLETIIAQLRVMRPQVVVIDSVQTLYSDQVPSAAGSVSQVRYCAAELVRFAKTHAVALFLVGHVTKEGTLAGPRVLEHLVDTVLYFDNQGNVRYRMVRAVKNRFGAVNELAVFVMDQAGLKAVKNPSALFLNRKQQAHSGAVVMATWEGTRPLLVEIQALVDQSHGAQPRRVAVGYDATRLALLLAVMDRFLSCRMYQHDVFVNVVGGLRIQETAADLAIILALYSSMKKIVIPNDTLVFGEIGLCGEIRPVANGEARLAEASKQGFCCAWLPKANGLTNTKKSGTIHLKLIENITELKNFK